MKKWGILVFMMSISLYGFAGPFIGKDIPRDVEREILNSFSGSGKERRQQVEDAKEAYVRLQNKAYDSNIPKEDLEIIIVRLHQMYGTNFRSEEHTSELQSRQYLV